MLEKWLDFLYPPCCGFCGKENSTFLCEDCFYYLKKEKLLWLKQKEKGKKQDYDEILWAYRYENEIRNSMIKYKFEGQSYLHATFSELLIKNKKIYAFLKKYDTMLTVPTERKKQALRGFSPTYLIAKDLAIKCGLRIDKNNLKKIRRTKPQSTLNREERKINLKGAFLLRKPEELKGKNVVLLDDVYTTGSTITECCKVLKKANLNRLGILIIAKD